MYQRNGNEIRNDRGTLVATITDGGGVVMAPGKKSQEEKVRAFLNQAAEDGLSAALEIAEESGLAPAAPPPEEKEVSDTTVIMGQNGRVYVGAVPIEHVEPPQEQQVPQTDAEWQVGTIPEEELPPFSPQLGTGTPGFQEYITKHNLNNEQVNALIRRICAKKGW